MFKMKKFMVMVCGLVFLAYGEEAGTQSAFRDVSGDRARHVVIAQGTPETYNGHATLVRTKSGRMIAVWTINHGGTCGPAAESLDGGKTWTRIDDRFPAEWKNTRNCPAIFALEGNDGKERLFGFIRGGQTNQQSLFLNAGWYGKRSMLKAIAIIGKQKSGITYDGATLNEIETNGPTYNSRGAYYDANGDFHYYDDETDNYNQQHYQLYYSYLINDYWSFSSALDYTYGYGYTNSYKDDKNIKKSFSSLYAMMNPADSISDYVYRKIMRNDAYTATLSTRYEKDALSLTFGGSYQLYDGKHYGNLVWVEKYNAISEDNPYDDWYSCKGKKHDATAFAKMNYEFSDRLNLYADFQVRYISYGLHGTDDKYGQLDYDTTHLFFNPKVGVNYRIDDQQRAYFVAGISNREAARADIKEALADGSHMNHETMLDLELGYHMPDENGNDVEDYTNRFGFLLQTLSDLGFADEDIQINDWYTKTVLDLGTTDLALSPSVVGTLVATYRPVDNAKLQLIGKYVGEQYADNTSRDEVKVPAYFLLNARASYTFRLRNNNEIECQLAVNNILDHDYRLSAYIYGTYDPSTQTYDNYHYWFQQPGINFMGRLIYRF